MKTFIDNSPTLDTNSKEYSKTSLLDVWDYYWYWMKKWGIPLEDWQAKRIESLEFTSEPDKKRSAYFITERCQNLPAEKIPDEFKPIIQDYMIYMMNLWGWPEWGYSKVKHLKPEESKG